MPLVFVILACTKSNDNCLAFQCVYDVNSINITSCIFFVDQRKDRDFICIYVVFKVKQSVAQKISRYTK